MQTTTKAKRAERTFTETARRAQIVTAAIEVIADIGLQGSSFARIAKRAGLSSTGLISYHFAHREDLINEVVSTVVGDIAAFMADRMAGATAPSAALRVYIEGTVEFIGAHPTEMKALLSVFMNGGFHYDVTSEQTAISPIERILSDGQAAGEFRDFDPKIMATLVQRAVDGLPFLLATDPDTDVETYGAEVAMAFDLATRASDR